MTKPTFDPALAVRFFELFAIVAPYDDTPFSAFINETEKGVTVAFSVYIENEFYKGPQDLPVLSFSSAPDEFDVVERLLKDAVHSYGKEMQAEQENQVLREQALAKLTLEERAALGFITDADHMELEARRRAGEIVTEAPGPECDC